jgi:uncharacterized protein YqcC (DUF446 family)
VALFSDPDHAEGMTETRTDVIREKFAEVVVEMKASGVWDVQRPDDEAFEDMGAFGMNTMALEQWLRWVFVPTIEDRLANDGPWPQSSSVGTIAIRNFDGQHELSELTTKLCEFDGLF